LTFAKAGLAFLRKRNCVAGAVNMGILDRDYMKRPSDDDGKNSPSSDSNTEELARKLLKRFPRLLVYFGVFVGILIVIAIIIAKSSGPKN
jgi:hypothetical protein